MKKWTSLLLAVALLTVACVSLCATLVSAEEAKEVENFTIENVQKDGYIKVEDGFVAYFPNTTNAAKKIESGGDEGMINMRYVYLLIFDKDGKLVGLGNNLLSKKEEAGKDKDFQNDLTVPAGGMLVTFVYNDGEGENHRVKNQKLFDYYKETVLSKLDYEDNEKTADDKANPKYYTNFANMTKDVDSDYHAVVDGSKITFYKGAAPVVSKPAESSAAATSSTAATSSKAATSSTVATSSTTAATSSNAPAAGDTGLIIFAILGIVAVAGAAVVVRSRH